jgi:endonuclease YncB( thermonuclease family)
MNARALLLASLGWPSLLLAATPPVQTLEARVVGVSDGDTITVIDERQLEHPVRLAGIDAPEFGQPFGKRARGS